jgi:hypothetical protein
MPLPSEALGVEHNLGSPGMVLPDQCLHPLRCALVHPASGSNNANSDGLTRRPNHLQTRHALCDVDRCS